MTYRFDKSGKRIKSDLVKDILVTAAENRDSQSNGLQKSRDGQRITAHRI
jgi:hypothetical protein